MKKILFASLLLLTICVQAMDSTGAAESPESRDNKPLLDMLQGLTAEVKRLADLQEEGNKLALVGMGIQPDHQFKTEGDSVKFLSVESGDAFLLVLLKKYGLACQKSKSLESGPSE